MSSGADEDDGTLTVQMLKAALPPNQRGRVTEDLFDTVEAVASSVEEAKIFRDNILTYVGVLSEGRYKIEDYVNACIYVSHKLMGASNIQAYIKTFPDRYKNHIKNGRSHADISPYVAAYNKNQLVNQIYQRTIIPTWVINQDTYQKAINTQLEIMEDLNVHPRDRTAAANSILTHLKQPEVSQVNVAMEVKEPAGMEELRGMMTSLAAKQVEAIQSGVPTEQIAHQTIEIIAEKNEDDDE